MNTTQTGADFFVPVGNPDIEFVKNYSKILTLGGHTIQDGQRGSEVLKGAPSSRFLPRKP
jgi:hypothetical protein